MTVVTEQAAPRVVVITGAASGIGLATLHAVRATFAIVVAVDVAAPPAELVQTDDIDWIRGSVAAQETWDLVSAAVSRRNPDGAHALIACAAGITVAPLLETPEDEWRRIFDINVFGVIKALQAILPTMVARGRGAVAVVCSVNSLFAEDQLSAYSVSKAALLHVVRSAALEYAHSGVRINAVCPGAVDTPMLRRHLGSLEDPAAAQRAVENRTPTGKLLAPAEIAAVLRFLVSDEASGMSGAAVVVDGGLTTAYDFAPRLKD
jgi:NAD(P)-dependent dehydrogenase (short-subunit alcohol dehydrogenase family)